jgi:DNA-binding MarR family transcriptional regulator
MNQTSRLIHVELLEDMINYQIYRTARLLRYKFQHDMRIAGLDMTQEQYFILFQLWQKDGQYQTELADDLFGDTPNITRILDVMEKKGFITRRSDPEDRRKYRIFLAERGHEVHELYKIHAPKSRVLDYKKLNDNDLDELKRILKTIENNITDQLHLKLI